MKKNRKSARKLQLHRETICALELPIVRGGETGPLCCEDPKVEMRTITETCDTEADCVSILPGCNL